MVTWKKIARKVQMKKIKEVIKEEVVAVQITADEFAKVSAKVCADMYMQLADDAETEEDVELAILLPMTCAKFAAQMMAKIFVDTDEESEEKKDA